MIIGIIIVSFVAVIQTGLLIYYIINQKKIQQKNLEEYLLQHRAEIDNTLEGYHTERLREIIDDFNRVRADQENRLNETRRLHEQIIESIQEKQKIAEQAEEQEIKQRQEVIAAKVEAFQEVEMQKAINAISDEKDKEILWAQQSLANYWDCMAQETLEKRQEMEAIQTELEEWRKKRQAINEEIMRCRQVEEQTDFYRIILTDQDKEDIHYLLSIINNIKNKQILYKLIWSEYIQKPFSGTLKRVLEGKDPRCVIYKITNLKTQEIYIGKTKAEVSKRWTEHIKTSLNIGTIARSNIHAALFGHWDEFSFEILEKVEDESQLSIREKYYINFYQSNIYGYNMNSGG